jgi:putative redox protein
MTLALYARKKQWPLEAVEVRLRHSKIHAADCDECETREGKLDRIDTEIVLTGRLDGDQRVRLLQIAQMCPVHRTLTSEIHIQSRLV